MRLFCFPYAGGSPAAFAGWGNGLPDWVDVKPVLTPRRWTRDYRPPVSVEMAVGEIASAIAPQLDLPYAFFGHSLGALMAYETAQELRRRGCSLPRSLYVSARRAPQFPDSSLCPADASDDEVLAHIGGLGGTPAEVLADAELLAMILPSLRGDFALIRSYRWRPQPPLPCPIVALTGRDDGESEAEYVRGWQVHTTHPLQVFSFEGGHFFLHTATEPLLAVLARSLSADAAGADRPTTARGQIAPCSQGAQ